MTDSIDAPSDPAAFFRAWLTDALLTNPLAHAMGLATAACDGQTSLRMVLLKAYGPSGFVFFTSPDTRKVRQLSENPHASLLFFWPVSHRQVRIDGDARQLSTPSLVSGLSPGGVRHDRLTWVAPDGGLAEIREALAAGPHRSRGFLVAPRSVSFWQGGARRRHATLAYERVGDEWVHRISGPADLVALLSAPTVA